MAADIRDYLIERFRTDGATLRQRAAAISAAPKPPPGPDAALSRGMADACDAVAALAEQLPVRASVEEIIAALKAMLPELQQHANSLQAQKSPAIKSVYVGASTRVQELITAELSALSTNSAGPGVTGDEPNADDTDIDDTDIDDTGSEDSDDTEFGDDDFADDELDDDEVDLDEGDRDRT